MIPGHRRRGPVSRARASRRPNAAVAGTCQGGDAACGGHLDIYGAGTTRYNIALLRRDDGRPRDARAALHDHERTGPGAAQDAANARDLLTRLEQASR